METTRQQKISRMLQKELGEIFLLYARKLQGTLITVSSVRVSPDLGIARTYLSIFPSDKANAVIEQVNADTKAIRFDLGKRVRHQLRIVPELFFHVDDSLDYLENIDNLLKQDPPSPLKEGEEIELD
ncbi:MAG: 30S ribosome-binding factor RbfA [Paludibacter sp.]|jgi:ribosome-binding factor A|nr:30S ribosome-binding factor RbfA [Paludibacter sp.]